MQQLLQIPLKFTTGFSIFLSVFFLLASMVTYLAASDAIAIIAPIVVWLIFSLSLIAAVIIALDRVQWFLLRRAEFHRDRTLARNEEKQSNIASDSAYVRMVAEAKLLGATIKQVQMGMTYPSALGDGKFSSFPAQIINQIEAQDVTMAHTPLPLPGRIDLSQLIRSQPSLDRLVLGVSEGNHIVTDSLYNLTHVAIAGVTRFGKSIFTQMLLYQIVTAKEKTSLYLADLGGTTFVDFGLPYASTLAETEAMIYDVMSEAERRKALYEATGRGIRSLDIYNEVTGDNLPWVIMIIDEALYLMEKSKAVKENLEIAVSWAAKYGITAIIISQDFKANVISTATRNNFSSRFQFLAEDRTQANILVKGCTAHEIEHKGRCFARLPGENRITEMQTPYISESEIRAIAPHIQGKANAPDLTSVIVEPEPSQDEAKAIEAYKALRGGSIKFSWRKATEAAYGTGKFGKGPNEKLRTTLDRFGIDYSELI